MVRRSQRSTKPANQSFAQLESNETQTTPCPLESAVQDCEDLSKLSALELMRVAMERNKDPAMDRILMALSEKLQVDVSGYVVSEKKSRSIVVAGLPEANPDLRPSERQLDLEMKLMQLLDVINVEC
ncbi:hypothetical protein Y032_0010g1141 [Ancylostoma ceylanicum]|uniref:Uncharacterized protein n=1 Tax=Ancylostoma ceylanicum TaxID=53326 RepID=A0A016VFJ2_9BILA|nr:hypothetical protein Y032_0010g1141 [Ancylostoma ceylanicum]